VCCSTFNGHRRSARVERFSQTTRDNLSYPTLSQRGALERAFNIVGQPDLRCYHARLAIPNPWPNLPYGGFGLFWSVPGGLDRAQPYLLE